MINLHLFAAVTLPPGPGPIIIIVGVVVIVICIGGIIYYRHKANQNLELTASDHCHVKYNPVSGKEYFTVTCEGTCKSGTCSLYSRPKGTESKWTQAQIDMAEDVTREYKCYCHNPNRPSGDF